MGQGTQNNMRFFFYKWIYVLSKSESRLEDWAWGKMCKHFTTRLLGEYNDRP
jgi:hypothetical protein